MPVFPVPLRPGDRIGVVAPSSGVDERHRPRLQRACALLEQRGYEVVLGQHLDGGIVSAPPRERAADLQTMLCDPSVRAIVPPWGGDLAIQVLEHLDWGAIRSAEPTWLVGYSDLSTILTPLTLLTGWATVHGNNLMDTPFHQPGDLRTWLDLCTMAPGETVVQHSPGVYRRRGHVDFSVRGNPAETDMGLDRMGTWERLDDHEPVEVTGRLIGGCIETLAPLSGTGFLDISGWARDHAPEGTIVYVEAAHLDAPDVARLLTGMRLSGFFDLARAVLVGRTHARGPLGYSQRRAVADALGPLGVPLVVDVECGHVPPFLPLINGALATVRVSAHERSITQQLVPARTLVGAHA